MSASLAPPLKRLRAYLHVGGQRHAVAHLISYGDFLRVMFDESYIENPARPTLSMSYRGSSDRETRDLLRNLRSAQVARLDGHWPNFFMNLLPEGHNRARLARERGCSEEDEFELLAAAGHDLMGALEIEPIAEDEPITERLRRWDASLGIAAAQPVAVEQPVEDGASLPGVVDKFSAIKEGRRYVVKRHGEAGSYIIKLPTTRHPDLVQNEMTGYRLCRALGLDCADADIVPREDAALPERIEFDHVLAVKRFDRSVRIDHDGAARVDRLHFEEFCQILNYEPMRKYGKGLQQDFPPILTLLNEFSTRANADLSEMISRIVAFVLMGNCDAHLKNWGFLYPDGRRPQLAPVYDPVCVAAFFDPQRPQDYAVNRGVDRLMRALGVADLEAVMTTAGLRTALRKRLLNQARETVLLAKARWPAILEGAPATVRDTVLARLNGGTTFSTLW